jgi:hypothetical protein
MSRGIEKKWEVVINTDRGKETLRLTTEELAQIDVDKIEVLRYIGRRNP